MPCAVRCQEQEEEEEEEDGGAGRSSKSWIGPGESEQQLSRSSVTLRVCRSGHTIIEGSRPVQLCWPTWRFTIVFNPSNIRPSGTRGHFWWYAEDVVVLMAGAETRV